MPLEPQVAEHGHEVWHRQPVLAVLAVGGGKYNGFVPGQTVDAHVKETADDAPQQGEDDGKPGMHEANYAD